MLSIALTLFLSFIGGFFVAMSLRDKNTSSQPWITLSPVSSRHFSLASLVLFVLFPPQEFSAVNSGEEALN